MTRQFVFPFLACYQGKMLCFLPTGNLGFRNTFGYLAVGEITQTKTKTDIPTRNTHFKVE